MSKKDEALKLALEALKQMQAMANFECWNLDICDEAITAIRSALAEQPAQGCEFCSHPLYAGTKCKNCGREQSAQQEPKIGCVNHDCDKCKARQQQEHVSLMTVLHLKDRTEIGYGPASAGYDLPTGEYKLYTSPPASKPWVGLTDDEIIEVIHPLVMADMADEATDYEIARAIEAKLKERNT